MDWEFTEDGAFLALCDAFRESGETSAIEFLANGEGAFHFQELAQNAAGEGVDLSDSNELDDFQHNVAATSLNSNLVVTGCAGSGKSIIALHRAKQIHSQKKTYKVIVYTKALRQFMEAGILELDLIPENIYDDIVRNLDLGDIIGIEGKLFYTKTNELTIKSTNLIFPRY